jgi:hypothetical protein
MSYLCYLCIVVSNTYCVVSLVFFLLLVYPMLPVSLDCSFLIALSVFSNVYLLLPLNPERNKMNCELMLTYDTPALRQSGSRNLTGQKTLPTIWGTYMKLVTKYQISAIYVVHFIFFSFSSDTLISFILKLLYYI